MNSPEATPNSLTLLVLAKAPLAGYSKTRLQPKFGPQGAARLAYAALVDTLRAAAAVRADRTVLVLDGDPALVPKHDFEVVPQCDGDHATRIAAAFEVADTPAVLIGMDTPQVRPSSLQLDLSAPVDAWLGLAEDGGWWVMGLRSPRRDARAVLKDVPMSTSHTGRDQLAQLRANNLRVAQLEVLRDVDTPDDAEAVAANIPESEFARVLAELTATPWQPTKCR